MSQLNQEPLVSIIIPSYNYAHFLSETLSNLLLQSYQNWECILVDNASTDNTKEVVQGFQIHDNRFKYIYQAIKGPSAARNLGIKNAIGDYIQFLDADDLLQFDKLKSALLVFNSRPNSDIVYSGMRYFVNPDTKNLFYAMSTDNARDIEWMPYCQGKKNDLLPFLLKQNIMVISSPLIKKESLNQIGYFDETLAFNEDWELWLRFAFADKEIIYDNSPNTFTLVRVHKTSHSNNPFSMYLAGLKIEQRYIDKIENKDLKTDFQTKLDYSIYVLERLLKLNCNDIDFLTVSIPKLNSILHKKKYQYLVNLINRNHFRSLKISLLLNYYYSAIIRKLTNA